MGGFGWPELIIILVIVLVLFGAKRLPEIGRSLGSGMKEFKDSVKDGDDSDELEESSTTISAGEDSKNA